MQSNLDDPSKKFFPRGYVGGTKIETSVVRATRFYEAHEEHQDYLMKNPNSYW